MKNYINSLRLRSLFLLPVAALLLTACGLLEGEPFIEAIHSDRIERSFNDRATLDVTGYTPHPTAFSHFAIFYRIYISDTPVPSTTTDTFPQINPTLNADFNAIATYIDSETFVGVNMHTLFTGRGFRYLALARLDPAMPPPHLVPVDTNSVLASMVSEVVEFSFEGGWQTHPVMRFVNRPIGDPDREFVLWRATSHDGIAFDPQPNRLFFNTAELRNAAYINPNMNADVADRTGIPAASRLHTFAALFIVGVGMDHATFSTVYSTPSLIHVFLLPNTW
ncbi:MAG: hypothetical protein FWB82_05855 [Treponema sp.]|nr:hypothetical protein [Treponema sp.]